MKRICVEMYDGCPFCMGAGGTNYDPYGVEQRDWHFNSPETDAANGTTPETNASEIGKSDCVECLRRVALLGRVAAKRLKEMLDETTVEVVVE